MDFSDVESRIMQHCKEMGVDAERYINGDFSNCESKSPFEHASQAVREFGSAMSNCMGTQSGRFSSGGVVGKSREEHKAIHHGRRYGKSTSPEMQAYINRCDTAELAKKMKEEYDTPLFEGQLDALRYASKPMSIVVPANTKIIGADIDSAIDRVGKEMREAVKKDLDQRILSIFNGDLNVNTEGIVDKANAIFTLDSLGAVIAEDEVDEEILKESIVEETPKKPKKKKRKKKYRWRPDDEFDFSDLKGKVHGSLKDLIRSAEKGMLPSGGLQFSYATVVLEHVEDMSIEQREELLEECEASVFDEDVSHNFTQYHAYIQYVIEEWEDDNLDEDEDW